MWIQILSNWRLIASGIGVAIIALWAYISGADSVQRKWDKEKSAIVQAQAQKTLDDQLISNGVSHAYQTNITSIDSRYAPAINSVRKDGDLPNISNATPRYNAATCRNGLSNARKIQLLEIAKIAELQTARLVACQSWIREQGK